MSGCQNRGRGNVGYIPTPKEVRAYRGAMTQSVAAGLICTTDRVWRKYESGESRMHPASWELLQIKRSEKHEFEKQAVHKKAA